MVAAGWVPGFEGGSWKGLLWASLGFSDELERVVAPRFFCFYFYYYF